MRPTLALFFTLLAFLCALGCAPGTSPAERALAAAESSWAGVSDRVRALAPQRAAAIELALERSRAAAKRGDWLGALAASQALPGEIEALSREIDRRDRERVSAWDSVNVRLARALPAADRRIENVASGRRPDAVAAARAELTMARVAWTNAVSAHEEGRFDDAMQRAAEARHRARRALDAVGLPDDPDLAARPGAP